MASADVERLRSAAEAYSRGDVEPLVALLDENVDWRAPTRGHLWWKRTPSCHGPDEARANFESSLETIARRPGSASVRLDEVRESGDRVMLGATWEAGSAESRPQAERFFQVVTMRDGKIVEIQGCRSREDTLRHLAGG